MSVFLRTAFIAVFSNSFVLGDIITLTPNQDNSIFSESENSDGIGWLLVGKAGPGLRRALVRFDIAGSSIPAGATINSVELTLTQLIRASGNNNQYTLELHPVTATWGEGTSGAQGPGGGAGTAATAGDATWTKRIFSTDSWTNPGGDFGPVSGTTLVGGIAGPYTFTSQSGTVTDVQNWLNNPSSNFGWLMRLSDEGATLNARGFGSRESSIDAPTLKITYTAVPEPGSCFLIGAAVIAATIYRPSRRRL